MNKIKKESIKFDSDQDQNDKAEDISGNINKDSIISSRNKGRETYLHTPSRDDAIQLIKIESS